jgi:DNA-binding MarR family transcriptional regulator
LAKAVEKTPDPVTVRMTQDTELQGWNVPGLDYPALRVLLVGKAMDRLNVKAMAEISDLSMAEWRVLSRLAPAQNGATVRDVAELAWSDRAEVSRAAASLERRGMISRRRNPRDRRAEILFCTEAGLAEHARIIPLRGRYYNEIAANITKSDLAALERALAQMGRNIAAIVEREAEQGS